MSHVIDIIVPIYNRETDIPRLISDMNRQSFSDFRIVFVDDGSTDHSWDILNQHLSRADFPYLLMKKKNGGAASARNSGLRMATAEWVCFLDSDDAYHPQYLEHMLHAARQAEAPVVYCNYMIRFDGQRNHNMPNIPLCYQKLTAQQAMASFLNAWISPCCLLINRDFQSKNHLFFDDKCHYCEDIPFVASVIAKADCVAHINSDLYFYYAHQGSLSRSPSTDKYLSGITCFERTAHDIIQAKSPASNTFNKTAHARYYIATLRKAAVQMGKSDFLALSKMIHFAQYKHQISQLPLKQKIACRLMLINATLFYHVSRLLFRD